MDHLEEGTIAPDFELQTHDGAPLKLSKALSSGPIALAFYKSACPTSQFTLPIIQQIFSGLSTNSRPTIWGISQDDTDETRDFVAEHRLEFPVGIDDHPYLVSSTYQLRYVPTLFLIGREQRIVMADFGFSKSALNSIARDLAGSLGCRAPSVFSDIDGLPDRRPG